MTPNQKYKNLARYAEEDAELERLEKEYREQNDPESKTQEEDNTPSPPSDEDKTWETRYANLRSFSQKQLNEANKKHSDEINSLKAQIEELKNSTTKINMPRNEAEMEEWVKDYPDLGRVLMTLARKQAKEEADAVRADLEALKAERQEETLNFQRQAAVRQLLEVHPDFYELVETPEFQEWVDSQPEKRGPRIGQAIYDALRINETDADSAIQAVSLFKSDTGHNKPKRKQQERQVQQEAVQSVRRTNSGNPQAENGKPTFSESQIERMSLREYEKVEEEIDIAKREGRFVYDITGAAR